MELLKQYLIILIVIYAIIAFTTFEINPAKWESLIRFILVFMPHVIMAINATENKNKNNHANNN